MGKHGEVLVAIMNNLADWQIAQQQHWYRIPLKQVQQRLKDRFPPQRMVFSGFRDSLYKSPRF